MSYGVDFQYFRQSGGDLLVKKMSIISLVTDSHPTVLFFKAPYHIGVKTSIYNVIFMVYLGIQVIIIRKN